jgi:protein-L-isoaspartate O-methyltransferase
MHELVSVMREVNDLFKKPVSEPVLDAVEKVDRKIYSGTYDMRPPAIPCGQTMTAPYLHAAYAEVLSQHLPKACKILEVGSGTGTQAAIYAKAMPGAIVITSDVHEKLVEESNRHFGREGLSASALHVAPGSLDKARMFAPFDAITFACNISEDRVKEYAPMAKTCLLAPVTMPEQGPHVAMLTLMNPTGTVMMELGGAMFVPFQE